MRILHIVSGVAPDLRFGGITTVALSLAEAQAARGHSVHVLSTTHGASGQERKRLTTAIPMTLIPCTRPIGRMGFGTIVPLPSITAIRLIRSADVIHVHLARDFLTMTAAAFAQRLNKPVVLQTHGMIDEPANPLAKLLDAALTNRVLAGDARKLFLTENERVFIEHNASARRMSMEYFPNGIPIPRTLPETTRSGALFLARLHPRKGAVEFTRAAIRVLRVRNPSPAFTIAGKDEGDGSHVKKMIQDVGDNKITYAGPLAHSDAMALLLRTELLCAPARFEPFGLNVIEALAHATPVLLHETAALAKEVRGGRGGWTFGSQAADFPSLEAALLTLLGDSSRLGEAGRCGRSLAVGQYSLDAIVTKLEHIYQIQIDDNESSEPWTHDI